MTKYAEAVERLADITAFLEDNSIPPPRTEFTSNIGEWKVMDELLQRGYTPSLKSGQHRVDILLSDGRGVEVKSAIMNERFGGAWLFDNIQPEKFDYLVCVKLLQDYSTAEYFIFSVDEARSIPARNNSDDDDDRRLLRIFDDLENAPSSDEKRINERIHLFNDSWGKLKL